MKWLRDMKSKFTGEPPFAGFPRVESLVDMPPVQPPAPPGQGRAELLDTIKLLERKLDEVRADRVRLRKQISVIDGRIAQLYADWPKLHAAYFTVAGISARNSETRKRNR